MKTTKKLISIRVNEEIIKLYQSKYPNTLSNFLRKCIYKAVDDYDFLSDIIFNVDVKEQVNHTGDYNGIYK